MTAAVKPAMNMDQADSESLDYPHGEDPEQHLMDLLGELNDDEIEHLCQMAEDILNSRSRFSRLAAELAAKGAKNPRALAAHIGRKKYGRAGMAALAAKGRAKAAAKRRLHSGPGRSVEGGGEYRRRLPALVTRAYDFELRSRGNGRTLEGYVAIFGATARIADHGGDFDEEIHRGAFDRSLKRSLPVMQFDHGRDPRVGTVPIGVYDTFEPDDRGYFVRGQLLDNPVVEPVRQAIEARAIRGMSWRMMVTPKTGDKWTRRSGEPDKRDVLDADVPEAGPVVFPSYDATSVSVRSWLSSLDAEERAALVRELWGELRSLLPLNQTPRDFTGRPTRGVGGGERDHGRPVAPTGSLAIDPEARDRALRLVGVLK